MEKPAIRMVNTAAEDLAQCNPEHLLRVFGEISEMPGRAKALRGLVALGFPSVDNDPRPNWQIAEVRKFIRKLDSGLPHFCYFLTSDVPFGFLRVYMYCLMDFQPDGGVQPQKIDALLRRLERDVRGFCDRIADRPEPAIERIMMNLPARVVRSAPPLRRAALRSLLPLLEAIVKSPDATDQVRGPAFREGEDLLGTSVSECGSESAFIARVREEAEKRA